MAQSKAVVVHAPVLLHPSKLNDAHWNSNEMTPKEYETLKESIRAHGFVVAVVVQKDGMRIIGGHHGVRAVKELSIEAGCPIPEIPCNVIDVDDVTARKLNIKLNHIHGNPNPRKLGEILVEIYLEDEDSRIEREDVESLGLDYDDALKYVRIADPAYTIESDEPEPKINQFGNSITLSLQFDSVKTRDAVKKLLIERTSVQNKKTGEVIADLLAVKRSNGKGKKKPLKTRRKTAA